MLSWQPELRATKVEDLALFPLVHASQSHSTTYCIVLHSNNLLTLVILKTEFMLSVVYKSEFILFLR